MMPMNVEAKRRPRKEVPMGKAVVRQADEGEKLWFAGGGVFTMKASAEETNGAMLILEDRVVRGKTTPLHLHPSEDELIYVLSGELIAHIAGSEHRVGAGGLVVFPRGVAHSFLVTSETAHLFVLQTPGTGERFYREASDAASSDADAARPPDLARLRAVAERNESIQLLGPPPFSR
jgi:quercetin dioxygenase-like cupin family protein